MPDSGLGFWVKVLKTFESVPASLGGGPEDLVQELYKIQRFFTNLRFFETTHARPILKDWLRISTLMCLRTGTGCRQQLHNALKECWLVHVSEYPGAEPGVTSRGTFDSRCCWNLTVDSSHVG